MTYYGSTSISFNLLLAKSSAFTERSIYKKFDIIKKYKLTPKQINLCLASAFMYRRSIARRIFIFQRLTGKQLDRVILMLKDVWNDEFSKRYLWRKDKTINSAVLVLNWTKSEEIRDQLKKEIKLL